MAKGPGTHGRRLFIALLLALIPAAAGLVLMNWPPAVILLENTGLDLLFLLRGPRAVPGEVCVVAIDEDSYWVRNVDEAGAWPRGLHGELVRRLKQEGARAVAFDVLFEGPGDEEQDAAFESGLAEAGIVVLGSTVVQVEDPRFRQFRLIEPHPPFAARAAAIGDVSLMEDRDGVIRSAWPLHDTRPSLAVAAIRTARGVDPVAGEPAGPRLIDYYGPARSIPTVSLYQALEPAEHLPAGFFKDRIVFVGLSLVAATSLTESKDSFRTPFRGGSRGNTFGVEIHATIAANLLEGRRIVPAARWLIVAWLVVVPLAATLAFLYLRPLLGVAALAGFEILPAGVAWLAFTSQGIWLPVVIILAVQLPLAYVVSVLWYYVTTVREREKIRRAFGYYLSPGMIRRITERPGELNLGGEEIVGTAMFTDIKGFTSIAETMTAPQTATLLNEYFSEATGGVFETGGTLIKYIGDAIFAIWGAPLPLPDHATQACRAALGLARLQERLKDRPAGQLVTRIGVHTGPMLVGNLGSSQRFDYTAIGDTVNLAARLEGINKYFGTRALASGETLAATDGSLVTRLVGRVQVVGRGRPVEIHELLGLRGEATRPDAESISLFESALQEYAGRRFAAAARAFGQVRERCGGSDGPSEFYLGLIAGHEVEPPPADFDGVIRLTSK